MWCTAVKRMLVCVEIVAAFGWGGQVIAAPAETEASVVARLYKDFGWQAFASQRELFGEVLQHQDKAVLRRYFAPSLVELLIHDSICQIKEHGICLLDFDILFDSQDPVITDLEVQRQSSGKVQIRFKDPTNGQAREIEFLVVRLAGQWKIADILYRTKAEPSLKRILLRR
ncbi:hypothetical protein ACZ75_13475 [Massilia sp. NR 4-1]|nr:hypothetical protein ACZ75_13475 [Massilia sp. NR 4-1]